MNPAPRSMGKHSGMLPNYNKTLILSDFQFPFNKKKEIKLNSPGMTGFPQKADQSNYTKYEFHPEALQVIKYNVED